MAMLFTLKKLIKKSSFFHNDYLPPKFLVYSVVSHNSIEINNYPLKRRKQKKFSEYENKTVNISVSGELLGFIFKVY